MDQTAVRLRHELKYSIDRGACALLRERLGAVMRSDAHAGAGGYEVRSLYFDDMYGSAYSDKSAGLLRREKFRLRIYDGDDGCIKLERKAKVGALCHKESERLSRASYDALLAGELPAPDTPGLRGALRTAARTRLLRPTVIVEYRAGGVRLRRGERPRHLRPRPLRLRRGYGPVLRPAAAAALLPSGLSADGSEV